VIAKTLILFKSQVPSVFSIEQQRLLPHSFAQTEYLKTGFFLSNQFARNRDSSNESESPGLTVCDPCMLPLNALPKYLRTGRDRRRTPTATLPDARHFIAVFRHTRRQCWGLACQNRDTGTYGPQISSSRPARHRKVSHGPDSL